MARPRQTESVNITVTRTGNTFQIEVDPDVIDLTSYKNAEVAIEWNITNSSTFGWEFASGKGIKIKQSSTKPFSDDGATGNRRHTWTRKAGKADKKKYRYSITVTDNNLKYVLDPIIINQ